MTDRVLIPLPGIGTLALSREAFEAALAEGSKAITAPAAAADDEPLLNAAELAKVLSLPKSWIESGTQRGELPCIRAGRWIRYSRRAVEATLAKDIVSQK